MAQAKRRGCLNSRKAAAPALINLDNPPEFCGFQVAWHLHLMGRAGTRRNLRFLLDQTNACDAETERFQ